MLALTQDNLPYAAMRFANLGVGADDGLFSGYQTRLTETSLEIGLCPKSRNLVPFIPGKGDPNFTPIVIENGNVTGLEKTAAELGMTANALAEFLWPVFAAAPEAVDETLDAGTVFGKPPIDSRLFFAPTVQHGLVSILFEGNKAMVVSNGSLISSIKIGNDARDNGQQIKDVCNVCGIHFRALMSEIHARRARARA